MNFRTKIIYDIVQPRWPRLPVGLGHPQKRFSQLNYQQSAMMKTDAGTCAWSLSVSVLTTYSRLSNYFLPGLFDMALKKPRFFRFKKPYILAKRNNHIGHKSVLLFSVNTYKFLLADMVFSCGRYGLWPMVQTQSLDHV